MASGLPEVDVTVVRGAVPASARDYLAEKITQAAMGAPAPVLAIRVSIEVSGNPAHPRPVGAKAVLDVNGQPVRAQVAATAVHEAADLLVDRLRHGLGVLSGRRLARRLEPAESGDGWWRHGMRPAQRPPFHPRPVEEREIVRRKTFAATPLTPREAAEEMELLDHDFHLFTDASSGSDALVERTEAGQARVTSAGTEAPVAVAPGVTVAADPVPVLDVPEAVRALDEGGLPRVFFVDAATGRGAVLYRRYDGHYGLVTAAEEEAPPPEAPAGVPGGRRG